MTVSIFTQRIRVWICCSCRLSFFLLFCLTSRVLCLDSRMNSLHESRVSVSVFQTYIKYNNHNNNNKYNSNNDNTMTSRKIIPFSTNMALLLLVVATIATTATASFEFDANAMELSLPSAVGQRTEIMLNNNNNNNNNNNDNNSDNNNLIPVIFPVSSSSQLVTLTRRVRDNNNNNNNNNNSNVEVVPIGRSYNGHDWERVAGPAEQSMNYTCEEEVPPPSSQQQRQCQTMLDNTSFQYYFTLFQHSLSSTQDEMARFFERVTFGPTQQDLELYENENENENSNTSVITPQHYMAQYIQEQIVDIPPTSHRAYFRHHLNPRTAEVYLYGGPTKHACDDQSQWRTFALTRKDLEAPTGTDVHLRVEAWGVAAENSSSETTTTTAYLLWVDGHVRTMLTSPLRYYPDIHGYYTDEEDATQVPLDQNFKICQLFEFLETETSPRSFGLDIQGRCRAIVGGNPSVYVDPLYVENLQYLDLSFLNTTTELVPLSSDFSENSGGSSSSSSSSSPNSTFVPPPPRTYLLTKPHGLYAEYPQQCATFPHPLQNSYLEDARLHPQAPIFGKLPLNEGYVLFDMHLELVDNTIENPTRDGNGNFVLQAASSPEEEVVETMGCVNAPVSIFNQDSCQLSYEPNTCVVTQKDIEWALTLDSPTLRGIQNSTLTPLYALEGLTLMDNHDSTISPLRGDHHFPCHAKTKSRWLHVSNDDCSSVNSTTTTAEVLLDPTTQLEFALGIYNSNDDNPHFKDIVFRGTCHPNDYWKTNMGVVLVQHHHQEEEEECYRHVHSQHMSVYDLTSWEGMTTYDSGSDEDGDDAAMLNFSSPAFQTFSMEWFEQHYSDTTLFGTYVGRYGDEISSQELSTKAAPSVTPHVLESLEGATLKFTHSITNRVGGTVVCGSPEEVAPRVEENGDDSFDIRNKEVNTFWPSHQKQTVWTMLALRAPDQLRQRMAFALSQIMPLDPTMNDRLATESNIQYYDIFVRHGLGNYGDVLREIVYNPRMGEMLTFVNSRPVSHFWHMRKLIRQPDENLAREFLQLFTIGLETLNPDGTPVLDKEGNPLPTHDSTDIVTFARAWTGFTYAALRGNWEGSHLSNLIDPMILGGVSIRDWWPKRGLDNAYVGDRYPLCVDLPDRAFLKKGATYRLLGGSSHPTWQSDDDSWDGDDSIKRVILKQTSALYHKLCNSNSNITNSTTNGGGSSPHNTCNFAGTVTLQENLDCEVGTVECDIDVVRVLQVAPGVFYEYLRLPCVQLMYYQDAKKLAAGPRPDVNMCGNPRMPIATEACCGLNGRPGIEGHAHSEIVDRPCAFKGERITYNSNAKRCADLGGYQCDFQSYEDDLFCDKDCCDFHQHSARYPEYNIWSWTTAPCSLQMIVDSKGQVATVHNPNPDGDGPLTAPHVDVDNAISFYSIHWEKDSCTGESTYPSVDNGCGNGACTLIVQLGEEKCLCDATVSETAAFSSMPTREEILSQLHVGAFDPDMFDGDHNEYTLVGDVDGVQVFRRGTIPPIAADYIFPDICESDNYIPFNADAERGTTEDFVGFGNPLEVTSPGYNGSNYAFLASIYSGDSKYDWRGVYSAAILKQCVQPFQTFLAEFQVRLQNKVHGSGFLCDAASTCPRLYVQVQSHNGHFVHFEVQGLDSWDPNNWNKFSAQFTLDTVSEEWFPLKAMKVIVRRGGATNNVNVVMLVDDIVISPAEPLPPAPEESGICWPLTNVAIDGFDEITNHWAPRRSSLELLPSGYNGTNGALAATNMDLTFADSGAVYRFIPVSHFTPENVLTFEYKIKVYNGTVPDCSNNLADCPKITLQIFHGNGDGTRTKMFVDVNGISEWNPGEWNSFQANFSVPTDWTNVELAHAWLAINGLNGDGVVMAIDDFLICEKPAPAPTISPSSSPSQSPTDAPSLSPSYSPSAYSEFTTETIFKVENEHGKTVFLKNVVSNVQLGGTYSIRNPPHFMDIVEPALRDAYYETDAVIDHFLHHSNTAPFISKLLIQHFGISNPSPRYVETVANAFRMGSYEWSDGSSTIKYGDGRSGSLAATAAAIALDREATTVVLDADPSHGSLREPLVKVVGFMRSMEYQRAEYSKLAYPIFDDGLNSVIGQMVYESPDIFSFFSPKYGPGNFQRASLVSPESQILSTVTTVGISNGLFSLIANGMSPCHHGFGRGPWSFMQTKHCHYPHGKLSFNLASDPSSAEEVVNELATLITSGRLSQASRDLIAEQYNTTLHNENPEIALRVAQQLIISSPEFHSTNLVRPSGQPRLPQPQSGSVEEPYKAIVYVHLIGGMDSFYMLAPHPSCDLYSDYEEARGDTGKLDPDRMLDLDTSMSNQPCSKFGLHENLSVLKTSYDANEAIFFANMGHLAKFVTKDNFIVETKTQLFSHSTMQQEVAKVDALKNRPGTGVLGRMLDVLESKQYSVSSVGINKGSPILDGDIQISRQIHVIPYYGLPDFYPQSPSNELSSEEMTSHVRALNGGSDRNSGMYGNLWSQELVNAINETSKIRAAIESVGDNNENFVSLFGKQMGMVAKMIKARSFRKVNRDAFFIRANGFDTHADMKEMLDQKFSDLNEGIDKFQKEMKAEGVFENITLVLGSEFGRTITPNSRGGTDHGWGGNTFVMGGGVKGGQILGNYPESFGTNDPTNDGRGRLIPTTSWDAIWNGIANWYGITEEDDLNQILPNRDSFGCNLFTSEDLYSDANQKLPGCGGDSYTYVRRISSSERIILTGKQQKRWCDAIVHAVKSSSTNETVRCVVKSQYSTDCETRRLSIFDSSTANSETVVEMSVDSDGYGTHNELDAALNSPDNIDQLAAAMAFDPSIDTVIVSDALRITTSPSMVPSLMPSSSPSRTPSAEPSLAPSDAPSLSASPSYQPSLSPSDVPSQTPSDQPSMSPSISAQPSNQPSQNPSYAPDFNWDIFPSNVSRALFSNRHTNQEIVLSFNISNHVHNLNLYHKDCKTPMDTNILDWTVLPALYTNASHVNIDIGIDVNTDLIQDESNGVWSSGGDQSTGVISFCTVLDLIWDKEGTPIKINFLENVVNLNVDMSQEFIFPDIKLNKTVDYEVKDEVDAQYQVMAYRCDENQEQDTVLPPLSQGDDLYVCVESTSPSVMPVKINSFDLIQDGENGGSLSPVTMGTAANDFSQVTCSGQVCTIRTKAISAFFDLTNSNDIVGSGMVTLGFGGEMSRELNIGQQQQRSLQSSPGNIFAEEEQSVSDIAAFRVAFAVAKPDDQSSSTSTTSHESNKDQTVYFVSICFVMLAVLGVSLLLSVIVKKRRNKHAKVVAINSDGIDSPELEDENKKPMVFNEEDSDEESACVSENDIDTDETESLKRTEDTCVQPKRIPRRHSMTSLFTGEKIRPQPSSILPTHNTKIHVDDLSFPKDKDKLPRRLTSPY